MPIRLICSQTSSVVDVSFSVAFRSFLYFTDGYAVQQQDQVRKGPTSVTEFEVSLADMYAPVHNYLAVSSAYTCLQPTSCFIGTKAQV